ncbi:unnamed protein product [Brachionus calyciflorus]|uniref:Protein kinase domain-containing protein n=1 Tax=Brachionus calyciflorus TaxID=104777 RepID=A0A813XYP6_9BILA|nr:unnamed protein product [Brachionus calyciflorus]
MGVAPLKYFDKTTKVPKNTGESSNTRCKRDSTYSNFYFDFDENSYNSFYQQPSYVYRQGTYRNKNKETLTYSAYHILGQGSFGIVYLAKNNKNDLVAVKCKLPLNDYNLMQKSNMLFKGELEALFNLKHSCIVRLLGVEIEYNEVTSLVMEHIPGEPMDKFIYKNRSLNESLIQLFTKQIVSAIAYMHSKFVMHRDIKSSNIMIVSNTWIKLIDFGMAKRLNVDEIGFSTSTSTMVGTIPFMAPEVRNFQSYNSKADIFSIGALIYEMANGDPFVRVAHEYMTETIILSQVRGVVNVPTLSPVANSFMQYCLIRDANRRPCASSLLEHPFISSISIPNQKNQNLFKKQLSQSKLLF